MSWTTLLIIAAGSYLFKAAGMFGLSTRMSSPTATALGALLPPAMLAALVAIGTFTDGSTLTIDERVIGVGAGAVAVWRGAPFWLVVSITAVVTATLRAL